MEVWQGRSEGSVCSVGICIRGCGKESMEECMFRVCVGNFTCMLA